MGSEMAEQKQGMNEQKATGASIIINFYGAVANIKGQLAIYENQLIQQKAKYKGVDAGKMDEEDLQASLNASQNLRYYMLLAYYDYTSLFSFLADNSPDKFDDRLRAENKELNLLMVAIKSDLVLTADQAERVMLILNNFLLQQVVKHLLESSQDIMEKIYNS
jgi:hypothetical protein